MNRSEVVQRQGRYQLFLVAGLLLSAPSGCGPGDQPNLRPTAGAQVSLNVSIPQNGAAVQNPKSGFWATLWPWLLPSEALAAGQVSDLFWLRVDVSASDLFEPTNTEVRVTNPASGSVISIPLNVPVGSGRVFTVSGLDETRARIFVGNSDPVALGPGQAVTVNIVLKEFGAVGSLTNARGGHTASLLSNGQVLVVGGTDNRTVSASAELFNPATQQWDILQTGLTHARVGHTATLLSNSQVLVVDGQGGDFVALDSVEIFNPATQQWTHLEGVRAGARFRHTSTLLPNGQVIVVGGIGSNSTFIQPVVLINPVTQEWTPLLGPKESREDHTATLLRNGQVLVVGGDSNPGEGITAISSGELFNPTTQQWTKLKTGLTDARWSHTATLLPNGHVLVVGGVSIVGGTFRSVASAELFNPTTEQWTKLKTGLTDDRAGHTATLLPNGHILLAGGARVNGNSSVILQSTELLDLSLL